MSLPISQRNSDPCTHIQRIWPIMDNWTHLFLQHRLGIQYWSKIDEWLHCSICRRSCCLEHQETIDYSPLHGWSRVHHGHTHCQAGSLAPNLLRGAQLSTAGQATSTIFCDNQAANTIAHYPEFHACMKHINIAMHFLCDLVESGMIDIIYIPSCENLTDLFTKRLARPLHMELTYRVRVMLK